MSDSSTLAQTYVFKDGKAWFVSTINRESSSLYAAGTTYAETMVWEWNPETRQRGDIVYQCSDLTSSISRHLDVCRRIFEVGAQAIEELNNG